MRSVSNLGEQDHCGRKVKSKETDIKVIAKKPGGGQKDLNLSPLS